MHRLRCLVVIGALAVVVSIVAAGPALAAKGGNSDNAQACQQGGHTNLFETETGNPFKNAGDCASHGAKGGAITTLAIDISDSPYLCTSGSGVCWGRLIAEGLAAGASWEVANQITDTVLASGNANSAGSVNHVILNLSCIDDVVQISSTTSTGAPIIQRGLEAPC
jgi:hypothetical protein